MLSDMNSDHLRRREALIALGGLGDGAAFGATSRATAAARRCPNSADGIYRGAGARALCSLKRRGSLVSSGYTGSMTIGVDAS